jgi:hypothetical protein
MLHTELLAAPVALATAVVVGTVAHELSHAAVLRTLGVPCTLAWFPDDDGTPLRAALTGRWAVVTPRPASDGVASWRLRVAAMTPLALVLPLVPVLVGGVPAPVASLPLQLAVVGWLACALPSPQDFSVLWYADRALPDAPPAGA